MSRYCSRGRHITVFDDLLNDTYLLELISQISTAVRYENSTSGISMFFLLDLFKNNNFTTSHHIIVESLLNYADVLSLSQALELQRSRDQTP